GVFRGARSRGAGQGEEPPGGGGCAPADGGGGGGRAETSFILPEEPAGPAVERRLAEARYDCVVIGAGVRLPPSRLVLFEALVNAIHRAAPSAAIAFNTRPEDTGATAARWISAA